MLTDHAGQTPEVGDYVAYNWSGSLAAGYIVNITGSKNRPLYHIERVIPPKRGQQWSKDNTRSKVRNSTGVLVLQKGTNDG
jgi:hypothetical protein